MPETVAPINFVFLGGHPAIDFANTLMMADGESVEGLRGWPDVVKWLAETGLATSAKAAVPVNQREAAFAAMLALRDDWREALAYATEHGAISDRFLKRLNAILAGATFSETLGRGDDGALHFTRTMVASPSGEFAAAAIGRSIANFLIRANFDYLRRCANAETCVLYFYDETKNHRRQWCSTATCGNRHKVAAFRERQKSGRA